MKKLKIAAVLVSVMALAACGVNDRQIATNDTIYKESGNTLNRDDRHDIYNPSNNTDDRFGFVREVKSPVPGPAADMSKSDGINREKTAKIISKMTVALQNVSDSSVVVTDSEVLISYKLNGDTDKTSRFETADQVKKTAMSVVPRWYHVYVTDDPALRQYVENIASMKVNSASKTKAVSDTVRMMKESSPQGRKMSENENANGETHEDKMKQS